MQGSRPIQKAWKRLGWCASLVPALIASAACSARVERPGDAPAEGTPGATGSGATGAGGAGGSVGTGGAGTGGGPGPECSTPRSGSAPLRRLSNAEYRNTVSDLFAAIPDFSSLVIGVTSEFPAESESLGFRNSAQFLTVQALLAEKYMDAAEQIAERAAQSPGVLPCTPAAGEEMTCGRAFVQDIGQRAYRRPLTDAETASYETQFQTALDAYDFSTAVEWTLYSLLQSPAFLYRVERGEPNAATTTRPTAYETATRLSYLFWQSLPDASLLDAARAGELETPGQIEQKAREMLLDPRSERLFQFFDEWLDLDLLQDFSRDATVFPSLPRDLPDLYRSETKSFVESLLRRPDGGFEELLTAPYTYANETLAEFYGLDDASGTAFVRVEDPRRSGILTQAMLMAQDKPYRTSIVRRGLKVITGLLCQNVPAPPDDVSLNLDSIAPGLSQRDRLEQHRQDPTCAGCHSLLDPIGLVFESFDAVGRHRTVDEDGQPIVTSSVIDGTADANGAVADARGLGALLTASTEARDCYVTQTFRFFFGREVEAADECSLELLRARFAANDLGLSELLVALTQTDAFLYRPTLEVLP